MKLLQVFILNRIPTDLYIDWIEHLLSERLQRLKPEVTPTCALICKRRYIEWSHHEERVAIFYCCEFVVFAYNHEIDEQSKSIWVFQATGHIMELWRT